MKQRPILFQGDMVRALLNGTKTQTRRLAKIEQITPHPQMPNAKIAKMRGNGSQYWMNCQDDHPHHIAKACPYGQPGDQIRVKETFYAFGRWETRFSAKKGRDEWHFVYMTLECGKAYLYDAAISTARTQQAQKGGE